MKDKISYQNTDITLKILEEAYSSDNILIKAFGITGKPKLIPTTFPQMTLDEIRADNILLLEDGTYFILEYESNPTVKDYFKYLRYIERLAERVYDDTGKIPKIQLGVVYTGNVQKVNNIFDVGLFKIEIKQVYLNKYNEAEVYNRIKYKIENKIQLTDTEKIKFN